MPNSIASYLDHALLHPTLTDDEIRAGCELAARYQTAAVCVQPYAVELAAAALAGSPVLVAAVLGFPQGANRPEIKALEAEAACRDGARELDMVINIGKAISGDWTYVARDIGGVLQVAQQHGALLKVIFENGFLPDDGLIRRLAQVCEQLEVPMIKTSTGFGFVRGDDGRYGPTGATEHDVRLMRESCSPGIGLKASGGIRTYEQALRLIELGATRLGTSQTEAICQGEAAAQG